MRVGVVAEQMRGRSQAIVRIGTSATAGGTNAMTAMIRRRSGKSFDESGFILVAVLWMVAALALLSSVYSRYVSSTVATSRIPDEHLRTEEAVRAAIELSAYQLLSAPRENRPTH